MADTVAEFPVLMTPKDRRQYPLCPKVIPLDMVAGHEKQAQRNHQQSLAELARRGGLDPIELLAVLDDRAYPFGQVEANYKAVFDHCVTELFKRVAVWTARAGKRPEAVLRASYVWECTLCHTINPVPPVSGAGAVEGTPPAAVQCEFCKVAHTALIRSPDTLKDDPAPEGAGDSTDAHDTGTPGTSAA